MINYMKALDAAADGVGGGSVLHGCRCSQYGLRYLFFFSFSFYRSFAAAAIAANTYFLCSPLTKSTVRICFCAVPCVCSLYIVDEAALHFDVKSNGIKQQRPRPFSFLLIITLALF